MRKLVPFTLGTVCILLALLLTVLPASAARVHHRNTLADPVLLGYTSVKTLQGWRHGHQRGIRLHGHDLGHRDEHQRLPRLDRWCVARLVRGEFSQPGARLDEASVASNAAGWVTVPLSGGVQIVSGTRYWLAIAATGATSTVGYRDAGTSGSNLDYSGSSATLANP